MSKRQMQERKQGGEDERMVAKSKTGAKSGLKDSQSVSNSAEFELVSRSGEHTAKSSIWDSFGTGKPVSMDSNKDNAAGSQVWHADANPNSSTVRPLARSTKSPVGTRLFPRNLDMSPSNVEYLEKACSYVRRKLGRPQDDKMERININATIWGSSYECVDEGGGTCWHRF